MSLLLDTLANDLRAYFQVTGPLDYSMDEIANDLAWETWTLARVLHHVRTPEFIKHNGWTVPNQPRGRGVKCWRLSDQRQHLTGTFRNTARDHNYNLVIALLQQSASLEGQMHVLLAELGGQTVLGKSMTAAEVQFKAVVATLEQVSVLL